MIEIIPKPAIKTPLWQEVLFYFSIALLVGVILSYFIIGHFQKESSAALEDLEARLAQERTPQRVVLEETVLGQQKKIRDFASIFGEHRVVSEIFEILEKDTHPQVMFQNLSLDPERAQTEISGLTDSFQTMGEQLLIFQKEEKIKTAELSDVSINKDGKINFTLLISFSPQVFEF